MFEERQQFNKSWLILVVLPLAGLFLFGAVRYFALNIPFGENSAQDIAVLGASVIMVITVFLFIRIELVTKIDEAGIHYQFFPFHKKPRLAEWKNLKEAYVRKYKPIKEYGGWGLRYGVNGTAYNIAGKYGIQLVLSGGKKILIGTQRPDMVEEILKKYVDRLDKFS